MSKRYTTMNGMFYDEPFDLICKYDILTKEFIENIRDFFWFNLSLDDVKFNHNVSNGILRIRNRRLINKILCQSNGNFIYFDCDGSVTKALVIGHKDEPIVKFFIDSDAEERFEMQFLSFKEYLAEMAKANEGDYTDVAHEATRKGGYRVTHKHPLDRKITDEIHLHKKVDDNETEYTTNDHKLEEMLHHSVFKEHKSDKFPHIEQTQTQRVPTNQLPRNYATDLAYNHYKSQTLPFRSSSVHRPEGHRMWRKLVDKALDDNQHVYHQVGDKLHKTTHEDKDKHLSDSYGLDDEYSNRHMIISKRELK